MSGGHSHGGGSGGGHSHGGDGTSFDPTYLPLLILLAVAAVYGMARVIDLGQFVYHAQTNHPHIGKVSGDWGSLFISLGFAVIFGGIGILLLTIGMIIQQFGVAVFGVALLLVAMLLGFVVAPTFADKVTRGPHATAPVSQRLPPPTRFSPQITSVGAIHAAQDQIVTISGVGFGSQTPFVGDLPCMQIQDITKRWAAGHIDPLNTSSGSGAACSAAQGPVGDYITIKVLSWTDSTIQIGGFSGPYNSNGWYLSPGDQVSVEVWNAQSGAGPATRATAVIS